MKNYYELGQKAFEITKADYSNFDVVDIDNATWCAIDSEDRSKLQDGYGDAKKAYLKSYWKPVWEKLKQFEKDNSIDIDLGCGCCGGGYYLTVNEIQYSVYESDLND